MLQDLRESSLQLPRHEEECPVDIRGDLAQRHLNHQATPRKRRLGNVSWTPFDLQSSGKSRVVRDKSALTPSPEDRAQALMLIAVRLIEGLTLFGVEQTRHHTDGARG